MSRIVVGRNDVDRLVRLLKPYGVTRVSRVCGRPAPCGALGEKSFAVRTLLAPSDPRGDVVRIVARVAFVVERELFDGTVPRLQVVEFVGELPLTATAGTRDARDAGVVWVWSDRIVSHRWWILRVVVYGD